MYILHKQINRYFLHLIFILENFKKCQQIKSWLLKKNAWFITPVQGILLCYSISLFQQPNSDDNLQCMISVFTLKSLYYCLQAMWSKTFHAKKWRKWKIDCFKGRKKKLTAFSLFPVNVTRVKAIRALNGST